jgi:ribosomal protein L16 Arg81 hydroxylase
MPEGTLMAAVRLAKSLLTFDFSEQVERVRIDNAVQSLRQIFFLPSELLDAFEEISMGNAISPDLAEYFANEFGEITPRIANAFEFLETDRFEDSRRVLIEDMELLREIRNGKVNVRREVSDFFREYVRAQRHREISPDLRVHADRVLGQINRLNAAIKECEAKLLKARKGESANALRSERHKVELKEPRKGGKKKSRKGG